MEEICEGDNIFVITTVCGCLKKKKTKTKEKRKQSISTK